MFITSYNEQLKKYAENYLVQLIFNSEIYKIITNGILVHWEGLNHSICPMGGKSLNLVEQKELQLENEFLTKFVYRCTWMALLGYSFVRHFDTVRNTNNLLIQKSLFL